MSPINNQEKNFPKNQCTHKTSPKIIQPPTIERINLSTKNSAFFPKQKYSRNSGRAKVNFGPFSGIISLFFCFFSVILVRNSTLKLLNWTSVKGKVWENQVEVDGNMKGLEKLRGGRRYEG